MARPIKNANPERLHINLPVEVAAKLRLYCFDPVLQRQRLKSRNISSVVTEALIEYFDKRKGEVE